MLTSHSSIPNERESIICVLWVISWNSKTFLFSLERMISVSTKHANKKTIFLYCFIYWFLFYRCWFHLVKHRSPIISNILKDPEQAKILSTPFGDSPFREKNLKQFPSHVANFSSGYFQQLSDKFSKEFIRMYQLFWTN